jgi:hypothetical protein
MRTNPICRKLQRYAIKHRHPASLHQGSYLVVKMAADFVVSCIGLETEITAVGGSAALTTPSMRRSWH